MAGALTAAGATLRELAYPAADGQVVLVGATSGGTAQTFDIDTNFSTEATLLDVDNDGLDEFIIGSADAPADSTPPEGRMHVIHLDTGAVDTVPMVFAPHGSVVALSNEEILVPVAAGGLRRVHLAEARERERVGGDVRFGLPTAADLDNDGSLDIVAAGADGRLHAFEVRGGVVPTWSVTVGGDLANGVSVADVDADGYLDVITLGTSGALYVVNYTGTTKPGWPVVQDVSQSVFFDQFNLDDTVIPPPAPAPLAADIDGDNVLEVLAVFTDGRIDAFDVRATGPKRIDGWAFQAGPRSVPIVGDFDGDGSGDLFFLESIRDVNGDPLLNRASLWNLGTAYEERADAWTMFRGNARGTSAAGQSENAILEPGELLTDVFAQPNPAGPEGAWLHYNLQTGVEFVRIELYDTAGQSVRQIAGTRFPGADNLVHWDGTDDDGSPVAPGLYVYRVSARSASDTQTTVGKVALIR